MLKFDSITSASGKTHAGFTSKFSTDAEAAAAVFADPDASSFAKDLANAFTKWGDLSAARKFWLHRVATPEAKAAPVKVDASAIEAIFATSKLKFPKFILTRGPVTLKVAKAGPRFRCRTPALPPQ